MARGRAALAVIVAGVIAACGSSVAPSPAQFPTPTEAVNTVTANPTSSAGTGQTESSSPRSHDPPPTPPSGSTPTALPVPPKPAGVSFAEKRVGDEAPSTEITQTVTWKAMPGDDVIVRVYGVTECVARPPNPDPDTSGPCLVEHTPLPESIRTLLATAPASDGTASWTWTGTFDCEVGLAYDPAGPAYHSVVLAAYSPSGHSIFAIAEPGQWWEPGLNDIVC